MNKLDTLKKEAKKMMRYGFNDNCELETNLDEVVDHIYKQAVEGTEAFKSGQIDGINSLREENYLVRKENMKYVQDCLATDNRKWIEPRMNALKEAKDKGFDEGVNVGYEKGLKENRILPEQCNPALTPKHRD